MTDEALRSVVAQHDTTIVQLVTSVEHLVKSQSETNKRLEDISKLLTKQIVLSTKLEEIDRNAAETFSRVHKNIEELEDVQKSEVGCNSVRILQKDVERALRDLERLEVQILRNRGDLDIIAQEQTHTVKPATLKWALGMLIVYSVSFGSFVVSNLYELRSIVTKQTVVNQMLAEKILSVRTECLVHTNHNAEDRAE